MTSRACDPFTNEGDGVGEASYERQEESILPADQDGAWSWFSVMIPRFGHACNVYVHLLGGKYIGLGSGTSAVRTMLSIDVF
jgi:hypothetical protein